MQRVLLSPYAVCHSVCTERLMHTGCRMADGVQIQLSSEAQALTYSLLLPLLASLLCALTGSTSLVCILKILVLAGF